MPQDSVRIADLLARHVDVQWYEGVAVVQGVCRQLLDKGLSGGGFPGPAEIALSRNGAVRVLGTSSTPTVPAAAHILADMLSEDVPVRLRLAVAQATGEQTNGDLREFSATLGYFERPDPEAIIRALVERVMLAPYRAGNEERSGSFHAEPAPPPADPPRRNARFTSRRAVLAALAVFFIVVGALGVAGMRTGQVAAAINVVKQALSAPAPEDQGNPKPDATNPSATGSATSARSQRRETSSAVTGVQAQRASAAYTAVAPSRLLLPATTDSAWLSTSRPPAPVVRIDEIVASSTDDGEAAAPIYSTSDSEVMPPRQVYPALASDVAAVASSSLTVIELVVGTDGLVERVRLRTPPKTVNEFMLLSAAKAWQFKPATSGGRPVRFLHTVAIPSS